MSRLAVLAVALSIGSPAAWAQRTPALEISSPSVSSGHTEAEIRSGIFNGGEEGGEWGLALEASHAVTDWWQPAILFDVEKEGDEGARLGAIGIESIFDFTATRTWPVHFGAYVEYEFSTRDDEPDNLELKLLMEREAGPLDLRLNLIGVRELGSQADDDWRLGYAAHILWSVSEEIAIGLEGLGDAGTSDDFGQLGDHAHYWGPTLQIEAFDTGKQELEFRVGYLAGIGEPEAEGLFRLSAEWSN